MEYLEKVLGGMSPEQARKQFYNKLNIVLQDGVEFLKRSGIQVREGRKDSLYPQVYINKNNYFYSLVTLDDGEILGLEKHFL